MKGDSSKPGWQARAVKGISEFPPDKKQRKKVLTVGANVPWQFKSLLTMAARRRGISVSGYVRRALSAFVANDLGMPLEDVLKELPYPAPHGTVGAQWVHNDLTPQDHDTGEGYGDWKNLAL